MKKRSLRQTPPNKITSVELTFREHLSELRRRIFYIVISIGFWSIATYVFEHQTIAALLRPAKHQQFIYTSPIGGVDFIFRVSLYVALVLSIPVIIYNILAFIEPLLSRSSRRFIAFGAITSGVLAACGLVFGYFIGLPTAMHFLLHQFVTQQIHPLLTVQSYLGFVMVYMLGSAIMLQIPLILIFINRIRPLPPSGLLRHERWVILGSFVMSGLMNPTPNLVDQLMVAGPLILMYQVGIVVIAVTNKRHARRLKRQEQASKQYQKPAPRPAPVPRATTPAHATTAAHMHGAKPKAFDMLASSAQKLENSRPVVQTENYLHHKSPQKTQPQNRPRKYIDGFMPRRSPLDAPSHNTYPT